MKRGLVWWGGLLLLTLATGCPRPTPRADTVDLLVIAPHPDDEVLLAGGQLAQAVAAGKTVAVIVVTNGDYTCERDGYRREAESVAGLASLGVPEQAVHFLGYPDGALQHLGAAPLPPMERREPDGQCVARTGTYADRGAGRLDEHTRRTGAPGAWNAEALTGDLAALLTRLAPREVVLPHAIDEHPDHAATYVYFRRALDTVSTAPTLVHRGIVHAGRCWPSTCERYFTPRVPVPPLPSPFEAYAPDERRPVDAQQKFDAITSHLSQTGADAKANWLASFARSEEVFFSERYVREGSRWVQAGSVAEGANRRVRQIGAYVEWDEWGATGFLKAGVDSKRASP